jgi:hypothetical protein
MRLDNGKGRGSIDLCTGLAELGAISRNSARVWKQRLDRYPR